MLLPARLLRLSGLSLVLGVLAVGPFFQGLFFGIDQLPAIAIVSLGFLLWLLGRRMSGQTAGLIGGVAGAALLALLAIYIAQFAWAVFPRGNLDWVLRTTAGCFAYMMLRAEAGPRSQRWLGWIFVSAATLFGLAGFLQFTGYFQGDPALSQSLALISLDDRIQTSFQYPNAAAIYFVLAMLTTIGLGLSNDRPWYLGLTASLLSFLSICFIFTISRGAFVIMPVAFVLLLAGLDRNKRWPALLLIAVTVAPVLFAMGGVGANAKIENWASAFRWIGAATLAGGLGGLGLALFLRIKRPLQLMLAGGALVLGVLGLFILRPGAGMLPEQVAHRMFDFSLNTRNVILRMHYNQDALQIVSNHPFGLGGGGWQRTYRQYQQFDYTANEAHNHYAQTAVDAGVPGLIALLIAVGAALWAGWQARRGSPLGWTFTVASATLAVHSAIDFNLSYLSLWLLLWAFAALGATPAKPLNWERPALTPAAMAIGTLSLFLAGWLFAGASHTAKASQLAEEGKSEEAIAAARRAARFDRWDSAPLLRIGDLASLERAISLDPGHAPGHWELALEMERQKDLTGALESVREANRRHPHNRMYANKVATLTGLLMVDALFHGEPDEATRLARELVTQTYFHTDRMVRAQQHQHLWQALPLELSPEYRLRYGQALYLTGSKDQAVPHLEAAGKVGLLNSEAEVWLYALYEQRGDTAAMAELEGKPWIRFRNANPVYKAIRSWP